MNADKTVLAPMRKLESYQRKDIVIKIYADGANKDEMIAAHRNRQVDGFTTNPTLMRKAGVTDYEKFARELLSVITDVSISFEVFADDFNEMERQARKIRGWGNNVHVKIPICNTRGESSCPLVRKLSQEGIPLNVTALFTVEQVRSVANALSPTTSTIVSVFAGRIADSGRNPVPIMRECAKLLEPLPKAELLWASSREFYNVIEAQESGCKIITVTNDIIKKLGSMGKSLEALSLDTVKTFYDDGQKAGYSI